MGWDGCFKKYKVYSDEDGWDCFGHAIILGLSCVVDPQDYEFC